jgi:hypothetical protein
MAIPDSVLANTAADSAAGYLFQCRLALLLALEAYADHPEWSVSIEQFDDVGFQQGVSPLEAIQSKHHSVPGNLTDSSEDLWKTLGIWMKWIKDDQLITARMRFLLITTAKASSRSAASLLRAEPRNIAQAENILLGICQTSSNVKNQVAYSDFLHLPDASRVALLNAITILDNYPGVADLQQRLKKVLVHVAPRGKEELLLEQLEGWWFQVSIRALIGMKPRVTLVEIQEKIDEIRDGLKRQSLPVAFASYNPTKDMFDSSDSRDFVRQLRLVEIGQQRILLAVRDFYRAFEQRSEWARDGLIFDGEMEHYERALIEAWEPRFAKMGDDLGTLCDDSAKCPAGEGLFTWAEQEVYFPLRNVSERFIWHGSFHILADSRKIGWHVDYLQRLSLVTSSSSTGLTGND